MDYLLSSESQSVTSGIYLDTKVVADLLCPFALSPSIFSLSIIVSDSGSPAAFPASFLELGKELWLLLMESGAWKQVWVQDDPLPLGCHCF